MGSGAKTSCLAATPQSLTLSVLTMDVARSHRKVTGRNMQKYSYTTIIGGREIAIETGTLAKLAGGAVTVRSGDSVVLATACGAKPREGVDFFPLSVDYEERLYAAGRIPGSFQRREGRPSDQAILISPPGGPSAAPALPQRDDERGAGDRHRARARPRNPPGHPEHHRRQHGGDDLRHAVGRPHRRGARRLH